MELNDIFNGFTISVDWLEFTLDIKNIVSACSYVGLDFNDFEVKNFGAMGYTKYAKHKVASIYLYWQGSEDMGSHIRVTGSAVSYFFDSFIGSRWESGEFGQCIEFSEFSNTYFPLFFGLVKDKGKLSRIDLALDDLSGIYYTTDDIIDCLNNKLVISKFREYENINKRSISDNSNKGHTIYFGSRQSDIMLRLYDKALEQKSDLVYWYRWEFELKDERANSVVDVIIKRDCIGEVFAEILNDYIRLINNDNNKRSRCSTQSKWLEFVGTMKKTQLSLRKRVKTIQSKMDWLDKQCMPTLAGVVMHEQGDLSFLINNLESAYLRNNAQNKMLYEGVTEYVLQ